MEKILDTAGQKGTGKWTGIAALDEGVPLTLIADDEIFGIAIAQNTPLDPMYNVGAMSVACPGWVLGTALGGIMGEILPSVVTSSLSIALYAMFLAIIIPPARENMVVAALVVISMVLSFLFTRIPFLSGISTGMKVIILTVALSALAAYFFPIEEDESIKEAEA